MQLSGKQVRDSSIPQVKLVKLYDAVELTADAAITATSLADVSTDLNFSLAPGTYAFAYDVAVSQSSAANVTLGINFTGTVTRIAASMFSGSGGTPAIAASASNNGALSMASIIGTVMARIVGSITVSTSGTLSLRAQHASGTTNVKAGTTGRLIQA